MNVKNSLFHFTSVSQSTKTEIINILGLITLWFIMIILVNPLGDFPLNDDWAYGKSVQSVVEAGDFQLSGWTSTNLFTQVYWGALFCLPFGFSFTALRFSSLTLGLIGVIATYGLLKEARSTQRLALLGALLVALNPIYFGLSNTFMSDVPFFAFSTLSFYFLIRGLRNNTNLEIVLGIFISYGAILIRQLGLVIPIAFGCAFFVKKGMSLKSFIIGFFPTIVGLGLQISYEKWLHFTNRTPALYGKQVKNFFTSFSDGWIPIISSLVERTLVTLIYMGLFLFPFIIILFLIKFKHFNLQIKKINILAVSTFFIVVMGALIFKKKIMPLEGNVLSNFGLGPIGLSGAHTLNFQHLLKATWIALTAIGVIGAALLLQYLFFAIMHFFSTPENLKLSLRKKWLNILIVLAILIYFFPLAIQGFFDRYLILLLPLLMMMISLSTTTTNNYSVSKKLVSISLAIVLIFGAFTVGATHDYLLWNRVRWQALRNLMAVSQISPHDIDGGFEFNGLYLYNPKYEYSPDKNWWWVDNDNYKISFGLLAGYEQVQQYSFRRWLPLGPSQIFVLRKSVK